MKTMVWTIEHRNMDDQWDLLGVFSTKTKAEAYKALILKEEDDIYDETSEFRIDWHWMDNQVEDVE